MRIIILLCAVVVGTIGAPSSQAADEPSVSSLIATLKSSDAAARAKAIGELAAQKDKAAEAVGALTEALKDQSADIRARAAHALGQIGSAAKPAAANLIELAKDSDMNVRRQAIHALMTIRPGPEMTVPLFVKLLEDSEPGIQVRILNAFADAGPKAVPGLLEALKNDKAAYWACLVARELGPVAKEAVPALTQRLSDPRAEVRREAILALAAIGEASAVPKIAEKLSDGLVAPAATYALGRIGKIPADVESKIQANAKGSDKMLSATSLWALGNLHPTDKAIRTEVTEQLIGLLKDSDPYVRVAAARALTALPPAPEITVPIWEKAMSDDNEMAMHHALDALARLGAPAVPRLVAALKYEKLRPQVIQVLHQIGPDAAPATEALSALLEDKNEDVARAAAMALSAIGPAAKAAVPALVKALERSENPNGHAIVCALGRIGPDAASAESRLTSCMGSQDMAVISAWALSKIKPKDPAAAKKCVPILVTGLTASEPIVRRGAAEALGGLGPLAKEASSALEQAAKDEDTSVREAATKALAAVRS